MIGEEKRLMRELEDLDECCVEKSVCVRVCVCYPCQTTRQVLISPLSSQAQSLADW